MDHEEIYTLMMEALDGELGEAERQHMHVHLDECPACQREWRTILAIHNLFLQSPVLSPAAGFAQRTMSRLPDAAYRVWFLSAVYGLLLVGGLLPVVFIAYVLVRLRPALNEPAFVRSLLQAGEQVLRLAGTVVGAGIQALGDLGQLAGQQLVLVGWLMVMIGAVILWGSVYTQLTSRRQTSQ